MQRLPVPLIDIPETQTVSAGKVVEVLTRYAGCGPWQRITGYYELPEGHRARDFQGPEGEIWSACELLVGTVWGYRVRLAIFPKCDMERCLQSCCQDLNMPAPDKALFCT